MNKSEFLEKIKNELSELKISYKNFEMDKFIDLINLSVNGDVPKDYIAVNANLENKKGIGTIVYLLTYKKIFRFEIEKEGIKSRSFMLNKITSIDRNLIDNKIEFLVNFEEGCFGIRFIPNDDKAIIKFFQEVDQFWQKAA